MMNKIFEIFFRFSDDLFQFKVFKACKTSNGCHIKTCRSLKRRTAILEITIFFLRKTYAPSVGIKMKPLRQIVLLC